MLRIIIFIIFLFPCISNGQNRIELGVIQKLDSNDKLLKELVKKEQKIRLYQGFKINGFFVKDLPVLTIVKIQVDRVNKTTKITEDTIQTILFIFLPPFLLSQTLS